MRKVLLLMFALHLTIHASAQNFFTVSVTQDPVLVANAGPSLTTCFYDSIQIGGVITGGTPPYTISWFPYYGLSAYNIANPMALPDDTTTYTITVIDANNCQSISQMTINIDPCAGIQSNVKNLHIRVYPNPVSDNTLHISIQAWGHTNIFELILFNIYGQLVYSSQINISDSRMDEKIDISNLPKGIYILEVRNTAQRKFEKIIVQ